MVMELIKTKPEDPVPHMISILERMSKEAKEKAIEQQIKKNNLLLTEEQAREY
jgi:hypothetical protein